MALYLKSRFLLKVSRKKVAKMFYVKFRNVLLWELIRTEYTYSVSNKSGKLNKN